MSSLNAFARKGEINQSNVPPSTPTPKDLSRLLAEMEEYLESKLDSFTTREYRQATEVMPSLVALETPTTSFLRIDRHDPEKAARRLALYWKSRRDIFGHPRWLLPMTQVSSLFVCATGCKQGLIFFEAHTIVYSSDWLWSLVGT